MSSPIRSSFCLMAFNAFVPVICLFGVGCSDFEDAWNEGQDLPESQAQSPPPAGQFLDESNGEAAAARGNHIGAAENVGPISTPSDVLPVHVSAGTALPQSFRNGTGMSFTVDYQFRDGSPNKLNKYFWVIDGNGKESLRQPVQLVNRGTLPLIAPSLRPEAGPFSSHILEIKPDGSQRKISKSINMR
jgi:hypothetical protein